MSKQARAKGASVALSATSARIGGAAGRRLIESASPEIEAIYAEITRRIGQKELMHIEDALKRIESELASITAQEDDSTQSDEPA